MTNKMAGAFCVFPNSSETCLKVKKTSVCPCDSLLVACLCENDSLHVTNLNKNKNSTDCVFVLVAHRLKSFCWQCPSCHGNSRLAGLTLDGHIQLFAVHNQPLRVTCCAQIHTHTIAGLLSSVSDKQLSVSLESPWDWHLMQYGTDWLCVLHKGHVATFHMSPESAAGPLLGLIHVGSMHCIQGHLVCVLQDQGQAVLYCLPEGSVVASLRLDVDITQVWFTAVAMDARTLVLVMRSGVVRWMSWDESTSGAAIFIHHDLSISSSLHSSHTDASGESSIMTRPDSRPCSPCPARYMPTRNKLAGYRRKSTGTWPVSGFRGSSSRPQSDPAAPASRADALVPRELLGLTVKDVALHQNQLQLSLRDTATGVAHLVLLSPQSPPVSHRMEVGYHIVLQHALCRPPLVLTPRGWHLINPIGHQVGLVNQLMLYGSAGVADVLCQQNAWDRCSIPMHALQVGLQHRQLDTIAFFLKSRENVLCEAASGGECVEGEVEQVHGAVRLLQETLDSHQGDPQAHQFSDQLMHITASFLHRSLLRVLSAGRPPGREAAARTLTRYLDQLWRRKSSLQPDARRRQQSGQAWPQCQLTSQQQDSMQRWAQMDQQEAITQALLQGDLALLQAAPSVRGSPCTFTDLRRCALRSGLQALQERSMNTACVLLANMGLCVAEHLHTMWLHTADRPLRDYLSSELQQRGWLSSGDQSLVAYVGQVESVYPCANFQLACSLHQSSAQSWDAIADIRVLLGSSGHDLPLAWCGEVDRAEPVNTPTAAYCCLLLHWLTHWSPETRAAVLWPHLIHRKDPSLMKLVDAPSLWDFLTSHGDWPRLQQWLEAPPGGASWPYSLPWDPQMLGNLEACPHIVQQQLKDAAARRGVVLGSGREWIRSLARIQRVMGCDRWKDVLQYLVEHELAELTYFYLEHIGWTGVEEELCPGQGDLPPWLSLLLATRQVTSADLSSVLRASVANHHFLGGQAVSGVNGPLLAGAGIARTLGTLLYAPEVLQQLLSLGQAEFLSLLHSQPRLHQALCPDEAHPASSPQLTVYTLLQGHAPFDMAHMFSWQPTNPLAPQEHGEMPHFTQAGLVSTWAAEVGLSWSYYVEQGRPCFAWLAYLQEQLQSGATALTNKQMRSVCLQTKQLALTHFLDARIITAAVAFMELLGQDSTALRVSLQAATLLHQHAMATRGQQEALQSQRQIGALLWACARGRKCVVPVAVSLLEQATRWSIQRPHGQSAEEWFPWQLVLQFCQLHQVPMSTAYLREAAGRDDWLRFLVFAQLHQFPKAQLLELLPTFPSAHLREHLHYVIQHVPQHQERQRSAPAQTTIKSRDVRAQLYARIGLKKSREISDSSSSGSEEEPETTATTVQEASNLSQAAIISNPDLGRDLFSLLLACNSAPSPWRCLLACAMDMQNCVLAVIAACYQGACLTSCVCVWLVTAAPEVAMPAIQEAFSDPQHHNWNPADLCELAQMLIQADALPILTDALEIFDPASAVLPFLQFSLQLTTRYPQAQTCETLLGQFKDGLKQLRDGTTEATLLLTAPLVESIVCAVLWRLLSSLKSRSTMGLLLRVLDETHATELQHCQVPHVGLLWRLHQATLDTGMALDYVALALPQDPSGQHEAEAGLLVANLTEAGHYNAARLVAEIVATDSYYITLTQLDRELAGHQSSVVWQQAAARAQFWLHCRDLLSRHHVPPQRCVEYFQNHLSSAEPGLERGLLLKLAYDHQVAVRPSELERENQLLLQLWQSRLTLHTTKQVDSGTCWSTSSIYQLVMSDGDHMAQRQALLDASIGFDPSETPKVTLNAKEKRSLDCLLGSLLTRGHLKVASRITALFGHYCLDLDIVGSCSVLAQGRMPPNQLSLHLKQRLAASPGHCRRLSTPTSLSAPNRARALSVTSFVSLAEDAGVPDVVLATLEQLQSLCQHATPAAQRITVNYRVAKALGRPFEDVLVQDELPLLHELLCVQPSPNYILVRTFILSCALTQDQVADFLCCTMVDRLQQACNSDTQGVPLPVPAEVSGVMELAQLCQSPSLLAQRLLAALAGQNQQQTQSLWLQVALLVQSHDCFTLACSMEGISAVLRAARSLAAQLRIQGRYRLLINLLTGVGRFNEMKYIFDILKQDDQFELLLKKGNDKEESLRVAILDYLQQTQPIDRDLYTMVALHFTMYRQIAAMLEKRATANMKRLRNRSLENSTEFQGALQNILHDFSDAAESYVKEKCVRHAEQCVRQARLIALQSHLLAQGSKMAVINLHKAEAIQFIQTHPHFYQAYIVEDVYRVGGAWPGALLNRFVLQSDQKYLVDFQGYIKITPALISEVADRYKLLAQKSKGPSTNMRQLLLSCQDLRTRMKLATDLGFTDLRQQMLRGPEAAFLKDCLHG